VLTCPVNTKFWIIFKGLGTYPTDSVSASYTGTNWTYTWGSGSWVGTIRILSSAQGFTYQPDSISSILLDGSHQQLIFNFNIADIKGPTVDSIKITPKTTLKVGDSIILNYRTVDNLCRNTYKRISIQFNNGPWILVDSMLVDQGPYPQPLFFYSAIPNDSRSFKTQKTIVTMAGIGRFQIVIGDSSGNRTTAFSDTFRVISTVSTNYKLKIRPSGIIITNNNVKTSGAINVGIFNLTGQLIYKASGTNSINLPRITHGTYLLKIKTQELVLSHIIYFK
jgi:hypothetical protein